MAITIKVRKQGLETFQVACTVSRWLEKFPDFLESFQMDQQFNPKSNTLFTKTLMVCKNFSGNIATLVFAPLVNLPVTLTEVIKRHDLDNV